MSTQVTVTLPDDTYRRAAHLAQLTGRGIAELLADTIDLSLPPLREQQAGEHPWDDLPDVEVLALAEAQMDASQERRLSVLLDRQPLSSSS